MRTICNFTVLFIKETLSEKGAFLWAVLAPSILWIINNYQVTYITNDYITYVESIKYYILYIILINSINGVGVGLIMIRESGFLKMYSFLSGNKVYIIISKILNQIIFTFISVFIFLASTCLVYGLTYLNVMIYLLLKVIFLGIPIFFLATLISLLPYRVANIAPITTILLFSFMFLAPHNSLGYFNVGNYFVKNLSNTFFYLDYNYVLQVFFYLSLGAIAIGKSKINSFINRN